MKYDLLIKKLHSTDERYIRSEKIKEYCSIIGLSYKEGIVYLTRTKNLYTLLRGIFYLPSLEERRFKAIKVTHLEALSEALKIKGVKNWYLGLETALKLNNLTHEYFPVDYVINDSISRKKPMKILGNSIMFKKIKKDLFKFGIIGENGIKFSDAEKTIIDIIYLKRYGGKDNRAVIDSILPYAKNASPIKMKKYAVYYNKKVAEVIEAL